jgi:hypothetical protein
MNAVVFGGLVTLGLYDDALFAIGVWLGLVLWFIFGGTTYTTTSLATLLFIGSTFLGTPSLAVSLPVLQALLL